MHILIGLVIATVLVISWALGDGFARALVFLAFLGFAGVMGFMASVVHANHVGPLYGLLAFIFYGGIGWLVASIPTWCRRGYFTIDHAVAMFTMIRRRIPPCPDRWIVFQFTLSVAGGILFTVAWHAFAIPLGKDDQSERGLPYLAAFVGFWFNKSIMFCIVWARFGLAAARSMRL